MLMNRDRAGRVVVPLQDQELVLIFTVVQDSGSRGAARKLLRNRDQNTVYRAYAVAREFKLKGLSKVDDDAVRSIVEAAKYSTTGKYVKDLFLKWLAWNQRSVHPSTQPLLQERIRLNIAEVNRLLAMLRQSPEAQVPDNDPNATVEYDIILRVLREQAQASGLPDPLEGREQLRQQCLGRRREIAAQLRKLMESPRPALLAGADLTPWEEHVLKESNSLTSAGETTWPPQALYVLEPDGAYPGKIRLWWRGHMLSLRAITLDQANVVERLHRDFVESAGQFLPPQVATYQKLLEANASLGEMLKMAFA
jgi:hypothetical protein